MFNNTYIKGSSNTNNIEVNSVSGTLVKNYRKSFFIKCSIDGSVAKHLFSLEPYLSCPEKTKGARYMYSEYGKEVVVLQSMIISGNMLLNEVMWKDDFDKMFEVTNETDFSE
jgi:hypothetical protein